MENVAGGRGGPLMEGAKAGTGEGEGVAELRQGQSQEIQVELRDQRWVE